MKIFSLAFSMRHAHENIYKNINIYKSFAGHHTQSAYNGQKVSILFTYFFSSSAFYCYY